MNNYKEWDSFHDFKIQMVRLFTQSEYSHVGVAWVVAGRVFVIEAVEPRARIYPLSKLGNFYHIPMQAEWRATTEEAAISFVGAEYKQLEALKAFFKPLAEGSVSECAALVMEIMMRDGIYLGRRATPDAIVREAQMLGHPTYYVTSHLAN
jgi:hypothetical protein